MTEGMAGFLAAEQLVDQSVSESRIQQAIDDAQNRQQAFNGARLLLHCMLYISVLQ